MSKDTNARGHNFFYQQESWKIGFSTCTFHKKQNGAKIYRIEFLYVYLFYQTITSDIAIICQNNIEIISSRYKNCYEPKKFISKMFLGSQTKK